EWQAEAGWRSAVLAGLAALVAVPALAALVAVPAALVAVPAALAAVPAALVAVPTALAVVLAALVAVLAALALRAVPAALAVLSGIQSFVKQTETWQTQVSLEAAFRNVLEVLWQPIEVLPLEQRVVGAESQTCKV
ncbi:unnamed protein product, partial [Symbiodinium natans]